VNDRAIAISQLLKRLPASTLVTGDTSRAVRSIALDSRKVDGDALFVALHGEHVDSHAFVAQAVAGGARAVVVEIGREVPHVADVTIVRVPETRRALSSIAAAFYGDPSHALDVIGVTGTNGKTTTTRMIAAILGGADRRCGVIGTVGAELGTRSWSLENTTPLPPELHRLLAEMLDAGAQAVALEVSSHALALDRVEDVRFTAAALTNVTRDHLDFHTTLEAYAAAKHRLFGMANVCVFNLDDPLGARWAAERGPQVPTLTYSFEHPADVNPRDVRVGPDGSDFSVDGTPFHVSLPGRFNVANALAAIGVARSLGVGDAASARGLATLERVPGRMEHVRGGGVDVVVDYSHTPDALDNALTALRETTTGTLSVVFGCGGDRDRGKRPEMGAVAALRADRIYVTSDNPRTENPQSIVDEIVVGIGKRERVVDLDRRRAIERAITDASPGDVVLIAGKGHEKYQIVGESILPFDDVEVARTALARLGSRA
jgi:UDP-N-acetylmuramoyl-L-alanyl-D-glutamate--2,6-diaminopimelate ligase